MYNLNYYKSMLKLRFSKPSIKTYADGKVTVCRYNCTVLDKQTKEVKMRFSVLGTAKCAPNDTVDAAYGRKLADSRAKFNAYKIAENIISPDCYTCIIEEINKNAALACFVETMWYLKKKEEEHIKFLNKEMSE